jgi:flavodoxin
MSSTFWSAIAALAALAAVLVSAWQVNIVRKIAKETRDSESKTIRVDNQRSINDMWQTFNMFLLNSDTHYRDYIKEFWEDEEEDKKTIKKFLAFQILNILYTAWYSKENGLVDKDYADAMLEIHSIRMKDKNFILDLLKKRGYQKEFADEMARIWNKDGK